MYQALLTRRYLTSKVMPLLAALAVALCVAMVIVVWSVMGGFLATLLSSGRTLMGDVLITHPVIGFPHYEALMEDLRKDPLVAGAAAALEAPGLLKLPDESTYLVQVVGVDGPSYDSATGYAGSLWWKPLDTHLRRDTRWRDERLWDPPPGLATDQPRASSPENRARWKSILEDLHRDALDLTARGAHAVSVPATDDPRGVPAAVLGIEVGQLNQRDPDGFYVPVYRRVGTFAATLSVLPMSRRGGVVDVRARRFPVVNNIQTGLYEADSRWVYVRLDALQEMLGMDAATKVSPGATPGAPGLGIRIDENGREVFNTPTVVGVEPARVTSVLVRAAPGVDPGALRQRCATIYADFAARHPDVPAPGRARVWTWDERPGIKQFVGAVRNEIALVLFLFAFISLTAVFLVFAIFWSMVSEKTKDVGILRAVGASRAGVAWLFLRYGVAIGCVGSAAGGLLALAVVLNINEIHHWLGTAFGIVVWTPGAYQFGEIPARIDPLHAAIVLFGGVAFSVIGALVPAVKASRLNPVEALRFE